MERTFDDQCANIDKVTEDAKASGVSGTLLTKIEDFLEDYYGMNKVHPFTFQYAKGCPGIRWDIPTGYCSVLFSPNDDTWMYHARFAKSAEDRYYPGMETVFSYIGKPSFHITQKDGTEKPYYVLPEEIDKHIKMPDNFEKEYCPLLHKSLVHVLWETNRYDGMISGYVEYLGKICYADMVDETPFERHRMFVLYELSLPERMIMMFQMARWNLVRTYSILWRYWMWKTNRKMRAQTKSGKDIGEEIRKQKEKFAATHGIVGYVMDL